MAWLLAWYDRYRVVYFVILGLFFVAGFTGRWQPEPDAALYLSIGRNLAQGEGYNYHGHPHALAYPGMPYLLAGTFAIFGVDVVWPAHALMLLMAGLGLALCYRLLRLHTDRPTAVLLTCMVGMTFTYYRYAFELRNDLPFAVGVLAFLAGWEACMAKSRAGETDHRVRWYDIALMMGGLALAMVMRPHMWVLLVATIGALMVSATRSPRRWRLFAGMLGVACVGGGLLMLDPRRAAHLGGTYEGAVAQTITDLWKGDGLYQVAQRSYDLLNRDIVEAAFGHELGPGLTLVAGIALATCSLLLIRRRALWGLFVAGTFLMMLLAPAAMPRYLLPILPLMAIAWWTAMVRVNRRLPARWGNVAFVLMLAVWVVPNFLRISKTVLEQRHPPLERSYAMHQLLRQFAGQVADHVEPDAPVLAHRRVARVLEYWSDRRVSAEYEMNRSWVPRYVVWPGDADVMARLAEQNLQVGKVVTSVGDETDADTHWSLRLVMPASPAPAP